MAIHLQCQQPVMNVIVNAPTTIVINRNNTSVGNSTMPNGNRPTAAANGLPIPLPIFQQLQPMAQNRSPLPPLSIQRRADDVAGTSLEHAVPPPRNGPAPQPNERASIYPEPSVAHSLVMKSIRFLCHRLESMNLERRPIDETRLASDEEEEDDKISYPNMIPFVWPSDRRQALWMEFK